MSRRNPNDLCPRGQRHSHQQFSAARRPSNDAGSVPDAPSSQSQLQPKDSSTDANYAAPTLDGQRHGENVSYRQSTPYWDDFNGIIYEIPYGKLLFPSKTSWQQADGGQNNKPQTPCAETAGGRPHGENEARHTAPSPPDTAQEYMADGENVKPSDLAPFVNAE